MLRTATIEKHTLVLLKKLQQIPVLKDLYLVGGTALALQLGHRHSVDLDLFGTITASHDDIFNEINNFEFDISSVLDSKRIHIFLVNGIKVDLVDYPYKWLEPPIETDGVKMAGLKDICAMKLAAITNRGTKKDFIDIYTLLQHFSLNEMLELYEQKFQGAYIFNVIRSLCYFADAETNPMPKMFVTADWEEVKSEIQKHVLNCDY
jgi:predicted nucleotidyltransferase component of viral defense system